MKNSSYFPKNGFASSECAQVKDNSVPSINLMGSLHMGFNESSHFLCIQWHCGVCENFLSLGAECAEPRTALGSGMRSSQQAVPPLPLGWATLCPTMWTQSWEAPRNQLVLVPARVHFITPGTSGEHLVLCSIHRGGSAFQAGAYFDL